MASRCRSDTLGPVTQRWWTSESVTARYVQLIISCTILGVGVALLLKSHMGSDGYSAFVSGLALHFDLPFWLVNTAVGAIFLAVAWVRGTRPGPGTLVQWILVGVVISVTLDLVPEVHTLPLRILLLALAFVFMPVGIAGYLASETGAGPAEAMALSLDPPLPFRWSYSILQASAALAGWLLGASTGVGTILVFLLMGPIVDLIRLHWKFLEFPSRERVEA